ncbi:hypothetical protein PQX77_019434 [Marasmius sp. AFHP31]|nr:hypothetical protein PQX77_019434 [Marasmius sp. AFHP31]
MHNIFNSTDIWIMRKKKFALPRQPKSPMESFGLVSGQFSRAFKRHLGFQVPLPSAPLLSFQLPLPFVPHSHFAIPAFNSSTDWNLNLAQTEMHIPQAPLARTDSEDIFDGPGSITAEEAASIPDALLDASIATDTAPSTSTPRAKRSISLNPKSPKFIRRMASSRATDNPGDGEADIEGSCPKALDARTTGTAAADVD